MECQSGVHNLKLLANGLRKSALFMRSKCKMPCDEENYTLQATPRSLEQTSKSNECVNVTIETKASV